MILHKCYNLKVPNYSLTCSLFQREAFSNMTSRVWVLILLTILWPASDTWIFPQTWKNVWVALVDTLHQDHICPSTAATENPVLTCLVGILLKPEEYPKGLKTPPGNPCSSVLYKRPLPPPKNPLALWQPWEKTLVTASSKPREFKTLCSSPAPFCVHFNHNPHYRKTQYTIMKQYKEQFQAAKWCKHISHIAMASNTDGRPHKLSKGIFSICGDQAWAGIPSHLLRGPCTLRRLMLFTPNKTQMNNWQKKTIRPSKKGASTIWMKIAIPKSSIGHTQKELQYPFFYLGYLQQKL